MNFKLLVSAALIAAAAVPASAVTLVANFNTAGAATSSVTRSVPFFSVSVSARRFSLAPNSLTNFNQTLAPTAGQLASSITQNAGVALGDPRGLGIVAGGVSSHQMDTNNPGTSGVPQREAFLVTGSRAFYLTNLSLSSVDQDDTLQIYGVRANGTLRSFTYGSGTLATGTVAQISAARTLGAIVGGANGSLLGNTRSSNFGGTNTFGTGIGPGVGSELFTRYLITTRVGGDVTYLGTGGQGFGLLSLTGAVPEPATWLMMLTGFGLVGLARRRRNVTVAA